MLADIVIPVGPYHTEVAREAIASARAQTLVCNVIRVDDTEGRGAAWARNTGVHQGSAPFVVFLDADDILHPHFLEHAALNYRARTYVYTDWRTSDNQVRFAVDKTHFFRVGMFHIITTLLPRTAFEAVGGFDESLPTLEDEDLYYKLQAAGVCGVRCAEPLVWYRRQYGRSKVNSTVYSESVKAQTVAAMDRIFTDRYGKYRRLVNMCDCTTPRGKPQTANAPEPGLVLVRTLYEPQRTVGPVSGRKYPRAGLGYQLYVDPRDAEARPQLWEVVPVIDTPAVEDVRAMALRALNGR